MSIENLSYFFAGMVMGYAMRVAGIIITVFEIIVLRFIDRKTNVK